MRKNYSFKIQYEKYRLKNGLQVILHQDRSTHTVALATLYHVGSAKEKVGKTGFAHLFEHLMFQGSENLKPNEFFTKINDLGGSFNGGTWEDGTIYYEIVPNDSLEKVLWMEADRMGYFINTVTQRGLYRELDIVINEKRQVIDNKPYGYTNSLIKKTLYPKGHPYHSTVIGEVEDLKSITLDDIKEFYKKYYSPNNATLAICGNIDIEKTKTLVEKYFGEIRKPRIAKDVVKEDLTAKLDKSLSLYYEDKFISMPELRVVFPGAKLYSKDAYALDILCDLIGDGKSSPLYKEIVLKENFAPSVTINNHLREHAGEIIFKVRAYSDIPLQKIFNSINKTINDFENNKINDEDIATAKNLAEARYYDGLSSNLYKAISLAESTTFGGSPKMIYKELQMIKSVTKDDIINVYNKYFKNKNYIATCFVPLGKQNLVLDNSVKADITDSPIEEPISKKTSHKNPEHIIKKTPSRIDRSAEPRLSTLHTLKLPKVWSVYTRNGINVMGIEDQRLPIVYFSIVIKAGTLDDDINKPGIANLTTRLLRESTSKMNSEELERAIRGIGANLVFIARKEWCVLSGKCVSRHFNKLLSIAEDIITKPSWNEDDFKRIKRDIISNLRQDQYNPNKIAYNKFYETIYGNNPIALPNEGTIESIEKIELKDLQEYYSKYFSPTISDFIISGNIKRDTVLDFIHGLENNWKPIQVDKISKAIYSPKKHDKTIYINNPNAEQAVLYFGEKSLTRLDEDYIPATLINYKLGEGTSSELFKILRLEHGYTYGIYSEFAGNKTFGTFIGCSNINNAVIDEAVSIVKRIISNYSKNYTAKDLKDSKNAIIRKLNSSYDTLVAYHSLLTEISTYELPFNFVEKDIATIKSVTHKQAITLIKKYLNIEDMLFLILKK
ncbi:MAG: insulinase family protein [Bacteroidales bacterium]|jgi:zinc protease|nr:insulinase family protein [Bacteroidales bacterium]